MRWKALGKIDKRTRTLPKTSFLVVDIFVFFLDNIACICGHLMLSELRQGHKGRHCLANIPNIYEKGSVLLRTCEIWFAKFRPGDKSLEYQSHPEIKLDNAKTLEI